jgi:type II secretory pathway component PulF
MYFQYTAKSSAGAMTNGLIEAASLGEARQRLREQSLFVLSLAAQAAGAAKAAGRTPQARGKRVQKTDILMLTSELAIMTQAGVDLAESLRNVAVHCPHRGLKQALDAVYQDVADGKPTSVALQRQSHVFGNAYVASIAAAEASGTMTQALRRLADLIRNEIRLRSAISSVLAYPLVLGVVATLVTSALMFFVLPQFAKVFDDLGSSPPATTKFLLNTASMIRENLLVGLVGIPLVGGGLWFFWLRHSIGRYWDAVMLNWPVVRKAMRPLLVGRTFRLVGTILQSGVPLVEAMRLGRDSVRSSQYRDLFNALEQDVLNGKGIGGLLSATPFVPAGASQMIQTAERTGKLGEVMQLVGEFYEDEGERQVRSLAKMLEPAIIVGMGIVVAFVVISVMLPLLDVSTMSH